MHDKMKRSRREIPAVTQVLGSLSQTDLPRPIIVDVVRRELARFRASGEIPPVNAIVEAVRAVLDELALDRLQPVVNATGVIIHTNLGRSPLGRQVVDALQQIAGSYSNLESDLNSGDRGSRGRYVESALAVLCQAEAATIVNNCAAALVLVVRHFTKVKPEVVISRGEIVQIGGGFRIGDILEATGAKLREIGATNQTTASDYGRAINRQTGLILKVHRSNFFMGGFVDSPGSAEVGAIARKKRVAFVEDLGSGAVFSTEQLGLHYHEPTPGETLKAGADLVLFSGDKLFGGPQAGIIVGKQKLVAALKREPLFRALRCDKLTLAALQATVDLHLTGLVSEIPSLALLQTPKDELRARAAAMLTRLQGLPIQITVGRGVAKVGGGTLPRLVIPSVTLDILPANCSLKDFNKRLRASHPPIVALIGNGRCKLDLRTILPEQDDAVVDAIRSACAT